MMKKQADQLQFLRFIAFFFIFIFHGFGSKEPYFYASSGAFCMVAFFFSLSGFGSGYSSRGDHSKETEVSLKNIVRHEFNKVKKVYPLFLLTTVYAFLITDFPDAVNQMNVPVILQDLGNLVRVLLFLQAWDNPFLYYNGVTWFLSAIFFLYLLDLPLRWVFNKISERKKPASILLGIIAGCFLLSTGISFLLRNREDLSYILYAFPPSRIFEYVAGMALGRLVFYIPKMKAPKALYTALEVVSLLCWVMGFFFPPISQWTKIQVMWLLPNAFVLLVFGVGEGHLSALFRKKIFLKLGNISMECYLIHQLVQVTYQHFVTMENTIFGTLFYFCFTLGMTVGMALLIHQKSTVHRRTAQGKEI